MDKKDFTSLTDAAEQLTKNLWRILGLANVICRSADNEKKFFNPTTEVADQIYELGFAAMEALYFLEQKGQLTGKNKLKRLQEFAFFKLGNPGGRPRNSDLHVR
jgi:hypothetical protein